MWFLVHKAKMKVRLKRASVISFFLALIGGSCVSECFRSSGESKLQLAISWVSKVSFPRDQLISDLKEIAQAPHPFGSARQMEVAQFVGRRIRELGFSPIFEAFTADTPNRYLWGHPGSPGTLFIQKPGQNIYSFWRAPGSDSKKCVWLLGSHYDTKDVEGISYLGANDSGSSSVALLFILQALSRFSGIQKFACDLGFVWFDGEESVLPNWNDGDRYQVKTIDHTYGSRHAASRLRSCEGTMGMCLPQDLGGQRVVGLILLDMIGSPNVLISPDSHSHSRLVQLFTRVYQNLYPGTDLFAQARPQRIEDDHVPYMELGLPVINIIDMNHLQYWHRSGDDWDRVDMGSIEKISRTVLATALILLQYSSLTAVPVVPI